MKRNINFFEFPLNLGLTKKEYETEPGVRKLPDWLRKFDFHSRIHPAHVFRIEAPEITILDPDYDENGVYPHPFGDNLIQSIKNKEE